MLFLRDLKTDSAPYQDYMRDIKADPKLKEAFENGEDIKIGESLDKPEIAYPE